MYCPKCAAQNADDVKFCRVCGTNLSLVPQALTGQLPEEPSDPRHGRRRRRDRDHGGPPNLGHGITKAFVGLGFLMVALALSISPSGRFWWYWMLIPAFASIGKGIAEIVSFKYAQNQQLGQQNQPLGQPQLTPPQATAPQSSQPRVRNTGELEPPPAYNPLPPPSVTEGTTRHLDPRKDAYQKER
jgi:hypothetical protein